MSSTLTSQRKAVLKRFPNLTTVISYPLGFVFLKTVAKELGVEGELQFFQVLSKLLKEKSISYEFFADVRKTYLSRDADPAMRVEVPDFIFGVVEKDLTTGMQQLKQLMLDKMLEKGLYERFIASKAFQDFAENFLESDREDEGAGSILSDEPVRSSDASGIQPERARPVVKDTSSWLGKQERTHHFFGQKTKKAASSSNLSDEENRADAIRVIITNPITVVYLRKFITGEQDKRQLHSFLLLYNLAAHETFPNAEEAHRAVSNIYKTYVSSKAKWMVPIRDPSVKNAIRDYVKGKSSVMPPLGLFRPLEAACTQVLFEKDMWARFTKSSYFAQMNEELLTSSSVHSVRNALAVIEKETTDSGKRNVTRFNDTPQLNPIPLIPRPETTEAAFSGSRADGIPLSCEGRSRSPTADPPRTCKLPLHPVVSDLSYGAFLKPEPRGAGLSIPGADLTDSASLLEVLDLLKDKSEEERRAFMVKHLKGRLARRFEVMPESVEAHTELAALGMGSVQATELKNDLQNQTNVPISASDMFAIMTVGDLASFICNLPIRTPKRAARHRRSTSYGQSSDGLADLVQESSILESAPSILRQLSACPSAADKRKVLFNFVSAELSLRFGIPAGSITPQSNLQALGLTSVNSVQLKDSLSVAIGHPINMTDMYSLTSVDQLVSFLAELPIPTVRVRSASTSRTAAGDIMASPQVPHASPPLSPTTSPRSRPSKADYGIKTNVMAPSRIKIMNRPSSPGQSRRPISPPGQPRTPKSADVDHLTSPPRPRGATKSAETNYQPSPALPRGVSRTDSSGSMVHTPSTAQGSPACRPSHAPTSVSIDNLEDLLALPLGQAFFNKYCDTLANREDLQSNVVVLTRIASFRKACDRGSTDQAREIGFNIFRSHVKEGASMCVELPKDQVAAIAMQMAEGAFERTLFDDMSLNLQSRLLDTWMDFIASPLCTELKDTALAEASQRLTFPRERSGMERMPFVDLLNPALTCSATAALEPLFRVVAIARAICLIVGEFMETPPPNPDTQWATLLATNSGVVSEAQACLRLGKFQPAVPPSKADFSSSILGTALSLCGMAMSDLKVPVPESSISATASAPGGAAATPTAPGGGNRVRVTTSAADIPAAGEDEGNKGRRPTRARPARVPVVPP